MSGYEEKNLSRGDVFYHCRELRRTFRDVGVQVTEGYVWWLGNVCVCVCETRSYYGLIDIKRYVSYDNTLKHGNV